MKLYLIRHGQTDWNIEGKIQGSKDIPLNSNGIIQAKQLSKKIIDSRYKITKIFSSKQKRAIETAKIISGVIQTEYTDEIPLLYPIEFDVWFNHRRYTRTPNGESYQDMLDRTLTPLKTIIENNEENVGIVTHSAVIMCLQCYLTNTPFEEMRKFTTDNTSITEIDSELLRL